MKFLMALMVSLTFSVSGFALETVEGAKKDYEAAKVEMKAKLDALDAKIDQLKASTAEKSTAAKEKTLKEVQETRDKLRADYELMKNETDSKWKSFKKRMGRTIDKLNAKAQKALND
ncbi:MAG: hypothetical protein KF681_06520 [Bdellovibrionaceae bacterium]|nr:hypothetical protein [Pseudobdellovibrionaceae bacterium]